MKEYKMAKGWAIFIFIFAPLLIGLFSMPILLLFIPSWRTNETADFFWFAIPVSIAMIGLMIAGVADTIVSKVTLTEQSIDYKNILFRRSIKLTEVKGFRIDDNYIYIEAHPPGVKRIKISTYFGKIGEIVDFLASNYPDLDELAAAKSYKNIIEDNTYGFSEMERQAQFKKAQTSAKVLNWGAGIVSAWTFFWPEPYTIAIVASMLFPIAAIALLKVFKGLIRIDEKKNSPYPSVLLAFFIPSAALLIRSIMDFNLIDYNKVWWLVLLMTAAIIGVLFIGNQEFDWRKKQDVFTAIVIVAISAGYSYGALVCSNCVFDRSSATLFYAQVLGKSKSTGKTTMYYLDLAPLNSAPIPNDVQVDKITYQRIMEGDSVKVLFLKGRWGIPWLEVSP